MTERFFAHQLPNGLRIVVERMPDVKSVAAGFLCRTGARDEPAELAGVSHFLEHMCFKGTARRSTAQINLDFDRIGGQPNAYTSQDRTFFHSVARTADVHWALDILADMMRSTLPPEEFDMEKNVVLEEIAMSNDHIEHVTFDLVLERVFAGQSLGWPVLGYERTIRPLTRDRMLAYFQQRYTPDNLLLLAAGAVDPEVIVGAAEEFCGSWQPRGPQPPRNPPRIYAGTATRCMPRFNQQVVAITFPAPSAVSEWHETAQAAASILGGTNSRFYWNIEQTGLSPHAGAYRLDYADCGLAILMAQCDPDNTERLIEAMRAEARRISTEDVAEHELQRVKNRRRTALAVEGESPYYRLRQVLDDVDYRDRPQTLEERLAAVEAISCRSIRDCLAAYPLDGDGFLVSVGPRDFPPSSGN